MSSWSATASITRRPTAIFPTWACSSARSTRPEMADNTKSTKKRGPFRGVAIWIIVALLLGLAAFSLFGRDGFEQIDTEQGLELLDRKSTRLNSSHVAISYAVFCLKKKT